MARLLILGGSNCQISAFRRAKRLGLETVLFDYLPNPPAAALADLHLPISTFDWRECARRAALLHLDGVMTLGTDQPVFTAAYIAQRLGLPSYLSKEQALAVTNKALMKKILTDHGIPTNPYRLVGKEGFPQWPYPGDLVMKPLDSQGQKGVFRVSGPEEAAALYSQTAAYSRCQKILWERYYPSKEVTVSAWVDGGKATVLTITDRITFPHPRHIGVCAAHRYPSRYARGQEALLHTLTQQITDAFGIPKGPLYIQYLFGEEGVVVNELACRIGGAFEDVTIPAATGFDILGAVMDGALGREVPPPRIQKGCGSFRVLMPFARQGRLAYITPLETIKALRFVRDAGYNFRQGQVLPAFEHAGARLGHMVLTAENEEQMQRYLNEFYQVFQVLDEEGNNMLLPFEE